MIRLEMKDYSMILIEKLQKYQPYYQANLISVSILLVKKYYHLIKKKKKEKKNKLSLRILLLEKLLKHK